MGGVDEAANGTELAAVVLAVQRKGAGKRAFVVREPLAQQCEHLVEMDHRQQLEFRCPSRGFRCSGGSADGNVCPDGCYTDSSSVPSAGIEAGGYGEVRAAASGGDFTVEAGAIRRQLVTCVTGHQRGALWE